MKIYDCFTFYNELDLLEIRFAELYNVVDYFVLVEANQTFTNRPKPYLLEQNLARFDQYLDKVIHIQVDDMPNSSDPWQNEAHQRNSIMAGLNTADPDDIVIVSDCDEILRAQTVQELRNSDATLWALRMPVFNFKFNYMRTRPNHYDAWAMACRREQLDTIEPDTLRGMRHSFHHMDYNARGSGWSMIEHAGWHFGYLGDRKYLIDKAQSFSHQEVNRPEFIAQIDIDASIAERKEWDRDQSARYEIVELDDYFPKTVKNYPQFILDNPVARALDFLPIPPV